MEENKTLQEILDAVTFVKDNAVTKKEFYDEIGVLRQEMQSDFARIDAELESIKTSLDGLEKRTREDADASANDVVDLRRRVDVLERQLKNFQNMRQTA